MSCVSIAAFSNAAYSPRLLQGPLFNLSIKEYLIWERPLLLLRNYNINKNLKFNPKSGLTKIHILPFYSAATFSASLQSVRN